MSDTPEKSAIDEAIDKFAQLVAKLGEVVDKEEEIEIRFSPLKEATDE